MVYSSLLSFSLVSPNRHARQPTYSFFRRTVRWSKVDQHPVQLFEKTWRLQSSKNVVFCRLLYLVAAWVHTSHVPHTLSFFTFLITFTLWIFITTRQKYTHTQTSSPTVYYWAVLCAYMYRDRWRKDAHTKTAVRTQLQSTIHCHCMPCSQVSQSIDFSSWWLGRLPRLASYIPYCTLLTASRKRLNRPFCVCVFYCSSTQYLDDSNHQPSSCHHTLIQSFCHHSLYKHQPNCHQPSALACHIQNVKSSVSY